MEVLILSRPTCDLCDRAKKILDRLAPEFGFAIRPLALDSPEGQSLALRHGMLFPPGLLVDGEPFSHGRVSERRLRRELSRRLACEER